MDRAKALEAMIVEKSKVTHPSFSDGRYVSYVRGKGFVVCLDDIAIGEFEVLRSMCDEGWTIVGQNKEQNIMKYSAGDVLENNCRTIDIQGSVGRVYITVDSDQDSDTFTEEELTDCGYTLKTETTKTDMSVSEIEKALGKAAGSLNVVAE